MSSKGKLCFGHRTAAVLEVPLVASVLYLQLESVIVSSYVAHLHAAEIAPCMLHWNNFS